MPYAFPRPMPSVSACRKASASVTSSVPSQVTDSSDTGGPLCPLRNRSQWASVTSKPSSESRNPCFSPCACSQAAFRGAADGGIGGEPELPRTAGRDSVQQCGVAFGFRGRSGAELFHDRLQRRRVFTEHQQIQVSSQRIQSPEPAPPFSGVGALDGSVKLLRIRQRDHGGPPPRIQGNSCQIHFTHLPVLQRDRAP